MQKAQWAIEADAVCAAEGHAEVVDGRCVRCRNYADPAPRESHPVEPRRSTAQSDVITTCRLWTRDDGCPLHGELCNPAYR